MERPKEGDKQQRTNR